MLVIRGVGIKLALTLRQIPVQEQVPEEVDVPWGCRKDETSIRQSRAVACAFRYFDSTHFPWSERRAAWDCLVVMPSVRRYIASDIIQSTTFCNNY